jgi:RNA polymerase sigma-70 factor (ECF subfamily)
MNRESHRLRAAAAMTGVIAPRMCGYSAARDTGPAMALSPARQSHVVPFPRRAYYGRHVGNGSAGMTDGGLEAIFLENRATLLRFLRARGAGADADDLLQDVWIRLSAVQSPGPIADPLAYIHRMADNLMHDRYRSANRRKRREISWQDAIGGAVSGISDEPSAERVLLARETLACVESALEPLSNRAQSIFRRFRLDGIGHKAIAMEHGISVSAVEKHIQRAYRAIMAKLESQAADEDSRERPDGGMRDAAD